jgi:hypothetical protein
MRSSISEQLIRRSFVPMQSTIPPDMTVAEWRRRRSSAPRPKRRHRPRSAVVASGPVTVQAAPCDHLHDCTTRYDPARSLLTFLLVCPVCGTERVIETQHYEPRYQPSPAGQSGHGATVHQLPVRGHELPMRRAA